MDFNLPEVPSDFKVRLEELVNAEITADRPIDVRVLPRDDALALPDIIRTQSNLIPADEQEIRIVDIVGLDVQADGGTHVASTSQVGRVTDQFPPPDSEVEPGSSVTLVVGKAAPTAAETEGEAEE